MPLAVVTPGAGPGGLRKGWPRGWGCWQGRRYPPMGLWHMLGIQDTVARWWVEH